MRSLLVLLVLSQPVFADDNKPPAPKSRVMATLERRSCLGSCPVYTLTIWDDGRCDYNGQMFVKIRGKRSTQLKPAEMTLLTDTFKLSGFFDLPARVNCDAEDVPRVDTFYDDGKRKHQVEHDPTCNRPGTPLPVRFQEARIDLVEDLIDEITGSARWVGTKAERAELDRKGLLVP